MIRHHLCNPSVQCSINDVSSATKTASTSSVPVPDINNNEDNFEDRMESGEIEKGGERRRKNSLLVKEENITRLEFETSDHPRSTKREGNEYETGSGIPSSLEDEKMSKEVFMQEPAVFSSNTCLKIQMIPSSLHPPPPSSKVLFPSTSDYANDGREVQPQSHKCCSSSLNSSNSFHSTSLHRLNEVDDEEMNPEGGREVQLQFPDSQNSTGNSSSNETEPELVIEFDEIRDDIELIVDIYLFIEKSSWALKSVLW